MSYVEIETGRFVKRWAFWNPATWSIPKLYWDAWSQEQRLHAICKQLEKVIKYADYLGVNVDDIAARLKAIEEGQLDPYIVAEIEAWFEENEPTIVSEIEALQNALPIDEFDSDNTVKDAFDAIESPNWVTETRIEDKAVTPAKISDYTVRAVFETVSDMVDTDLESGYVETLGYHVKGIGGTKYEISETAESYSITLTNGKYATPIFDEYEIYPETFGAYGDGTHDDSTAIQTAIDNCAEGGCVKFTLDDYYIETTLEIDKPRITLCGYGYYYKNKIDANVSPAIQISGSNCSVEHLYFVSYGNTLSSSPTRTAIRMNIVDHNDFICSESGFINFEKCIECSGRNVVLKNSYITHCLKGIHVRYDALAGNTLGITVEGCDFHECDDDTNPANAITWQNARCWVMDIDNNVTVRSALIMGNNFSGASFIGFYRGPSPVWIEGNRGVNLEGGACGHVYINSYNNSGFPIYMNNLVKCLGQKGVNNARDFYLTHLIAGYIAYMQMSGNNFTLPQNNNCLIENLGGADPGQNYGALLYTANTIFSIGTPFTVFKYNTSTATGGNYVCCSGNIFRSGQSPTNCKIFGDASLADDFANTNYYTGFTVS